MKSLTELSIKRPLLITVVFVTLILFGFLSYNNLNYELLPKFDANVVTVVTTYRGASAEEIETAVTKNIEDAVSSMEGVDKISANSQQGVSIVTIQLLNGIVVDKALSDAQRKVDQVLATLPDDVDKPLVNKFSTDDFPILRMGVTANVDERQLYDVIDDQIKPQLANIEGVGQVNIIGGNERQILVKVDRNKLQSYGLSIAQLSTIVTASSLSTPAGKIESDKDQFAITFDAKFSNINDLRNMVVFQSPNGGKVLLSDVANVEDGQVDATQINHTNGLPSIGIQIMKQSDANAVAVSELTKAKLTLLSEQYKALGLKFDVAQDQSTYTLKSAHAVTEDLMYAVVIVSIVMLFFLHSIRSSLFVLVALPASMIPTFIFMYLLGFSLNLMTLMALSLVVGILVDDSIVILENIMRHMEMGKSRRRATIDGRAEIGFTAIAITLVDVVVFLPMSMAGGLIGNIIREFSLVVVCSTLMSLLVCFTLTPLLASRFGRLVHLSDKNLWGRINLWFEAQLTALRDGYTQILAWGLRRKRWVFGFVLVLFAGSIMLVANGFIGFAFVSKGDNGETLIKLELPQQTTLYQTNMVTQQAERILLRQPEVINVFSNVGYSSNGVVTADNSNIAEINVKLVDKEMRAISSDDFSERMKDSISVITGVKVTSTQVGITGGADQADVQIVVKGPRREEMKQLADKMKAIVEKTPGTMYVEFSTKNPKPEIDVQLDREKMAIFGLNPQQVGLAISNAFRGNDQAKYKFDGKEYKIMVQNNEGNRTSIDDVRNLNFVNSQGQSFTLGQFANIRQKMGESVLERMNRLPSITINASVIGRSVGVVGQDLQKEFDAIKFPAGTSWEFIGNLANQADSFSSLLIALVVGILLVYLIMVALYENAIYPFVVLFALPLAMIGAFLALAITMNEMSIFAMIGLIMLMGLVAKNGILLVDFTNQLKKEGHDLVSALIEAGKERFRPILMTTIAMIAGMLPIALATGSGAEVKSGMAWVIIGGLTSSLILTLVVVPCVYFIVDKVLTYKLMKPVIFSFLLSSVIFGIGISVVNKMGLSSTVSGILIVILVLVYILLIRVFYKLLNKWLKQNRIDKFRKGRLKLQAQKA